MVQPYWMRRWEQVYSRPWTPRAQGTRSQREGREGSRGGKKGPCPAHCPALGSDQERRCVLRCPPTAQHSIPAPR